MESKKVAAEVATDKGDIEIEVFDDGVVKEILVEAGAEVPVGTVLAVIAGGEEVETHPPPEVERVKASPVARRLATVRGIDLRSLRGTGPGGAITREDVEQGPPEPTDRPIAPPKTEGMRLAIAAAMARSNREIPHYYLETHLDMKRPLEFLAQANRRLPLEERLLPVALLLKGVARALEDVPELNGYWIDGTLQASDAIHLGLAVALRGGGLVTPAIHDVNKRALHDVSTP